MHKLQEGHEAHGDKRKTGRRPELEARLKIFAESHGGERDGRSETHCSGNKAGHEAERRMVNFPEEMIFAAGTRKSSAQFAVAKCTAERGDSADYPQHEQRKSRLNIRYLKDDAGKHAGA